MLYMRRFKAVNVRREVERKVRRWVLRKVRMWERRLVVVAEVEGLLSDFELGVSRYHSMDIP